MDTKASKTSIAFFVMAFFCIALINPQAYSKKLNQNNNHFIIKDVRFYDGDTLIEKTDIEIKDQKVYKIAKKITADSSVEIISGKGKTLLPGLIDAHTHAYGNALKNALNFGVTTELDMFSIPEYSKDNMLATDAIDNTKAADFFSSSILATAPAGHGTQYGFKIPVLESVAETEKFVEDRINEGASYIKVVYNSKNANKPGHFFSSISLKVLKSLIKHTHVKGKILVVHADNYISALEAIESGADGLVHSFMDKIVDDKFIQLMRDKNAFMIPTLSVAASISQIANPDDLLNDDYFKKFISKEQTQQLKASFPAFGIPESGFQIALDSVKLLSAAGVAMLAGSDAPNPGTTHGISMYQEIELLIKAGLSNQMAIHSATGAARGHFPIDTRGTLKIGARASMILVAGNPFTEIKQLRQIKKIWKNGVLFERVEAQNIISNVNTLKAGLITDFNESLAKTKIGQGIAETTDQYAGGKSVVSLSHKSRDEKSDKFLHISGEIKEGFMYKWSGMSYIVGADYQSGVNLSAIESLNFDAKAGQNTHKITIMLFQTGSYNPISQTIKLSQQWQNYTISLSDFENLDVENVANISIVMVDKLGKFEFMLDNLSFK